LELDEKKLKDKIEKAHRVKLEKEFAEKEEIKRRQKVCDKREEFLKSLAKTDNPQGKFDEVCDHIKE